MADPVTLATISLVATTVGGGISAYGGYESSQYRSKVAENNAKIAEQKAKYAEAAGQVQAQNNEMKTTSVVSREKAIQGASGIDVESNSSTAVRKSTQALGDLDTATILHQAMKTAMGFRQEGVNYKAESELISRAGNYGLAGSLLSTAGKVSDKWMTFKEKGIGSGVYDDQYEGP